MRAKRPWWLWILLATGAVATIAIISGGGDNRAREATAAQRAASADATGSTIADARRAVDEDRYDEATEIVSDLDIDALGSILHRIANRLGERAIDAVQSGDRVRARELVIAAKAYPSTERTVRAHATYKRAKASAPTHEAPQSDCDPNYEGACLNAQSPDYDCEGGSGNGPDYTGTVQSVGSDPFDLDRDGDGIGCE